MKPSRKHGHDGHQVSHEFLLRREGFAVDDHDLGMMPLAECLKVFIAKTHQPISMSNEESSYLSQFDQFHEPVKLLPFIVQSTANIREPFIDPESMLLAIDFKRPDLIRQIRLLSHP